MTTDSHSRGSEEDHIRRKVKKEDAQKNGKKMNQEEFDKEIVEMKEQLDALMMILEENHRLGWVLKKNPIRWHKLKRRIQWRQLMWLMGKLKEVE